MFDFSLTEIGVVLFVAVAVLGPKELPQAMRTMGKVMRQVRKLSGEFQGHVNDLMREAELDDVRNTVQRVTHANVSQEIGKLLDPGGEFAEEVARTEQQMQEAMKVNPPPPAPEVAPHPALEPATASPAAPAAAPEAAISPPDAAVSHPPQQGGP